MSTIGSYILKQAIKPLVFVTSVALMMLLTERMLRLLDVVLDSRSSLHILVEMLAFLIPHYIALALPLAFFLGVLVAFRGMFQRNELDALGAGGVGLYSLLRPILTLAVFLTVISAINISLVQPYARYIYRSLVNNVTALAVNTYFREGVFLEVDGYTVMAEEISYDRNDFSNVFIYQQGRDGRSRVVTAGRGQLIRSEAGDRSALLLGNGKGLRVAPRSESAETNASIDFDVLAFERLKVPIALGKPLPFRSRGKDERELTLVELWQDRYTPPQGATYDEMLAEFNDRVVRILSILFLPFLAIGFAIGPRRTQRAYNVVFGMLTLIVYNEVVRVGKIATSDGLLPFFLGQWVPFILFASYSLYLFYRQASRVPKASRLDLAIAQLAESLQALLSSVIARSRLQRRLRYAHLDRLQ